MSRAGNPWFPARPVDSIDHAADPPFVIGAPRNGDLETRYCIGNIDVA